MLSSCASVAILVGHILHCTVSVLGGEEGCTVKSTHLPAGVPEGEARGNSLRQRGIFDRISRFESQYGQHIILTISKLLIPSLNSLTISPYTPKGVYCEI